MSENNTLEIKLQAVFLQLRSFSDYPIKDDTILQKLHSSVHDLLQTKENRKYLLKGPTFLKKNY